MRLELDYIKKFYEYRDKKFAVEQESLLDDLKNVDTFQSVMGFLNPAYFMVYWKPAETNIFYSHSWLGLPR